MELILNHMETIFFIFVGVLFCSFLYLLWNEVIMLFKNPTILTLSLSILLLKRFIFFLMGLNFSFTLTKVDSLLSIESNSIWNLVLLLLLDSLCVCLVLFLLFQTQKVKRKINIWQMIETIKISYMKVLFGTFIGWGILILTVTSLSILIENSQDKFVFTITVICWIWNILSAFLLIDLFLKNESSFFRTTFNSLKKGALLLYENIQLKVPTKENLSLIILIHCMIIGIFPIIMFFYDLLGQNIKSTQIILTDISFIETWHVNWLWLGGIPSNSFWSEKLISLIDFSNYGILEILFLILFSFTSILVKLKLIRAKM